MNHIEDTKKHFREHQTQSFMRLLQQNPNNFDPLSWKTAGEEYIKRFLRTKDVREYLDQIFKVTDELMEAQTLIRALVQMWLQEKT